jgi:integrase
MRLPAIDAEEPSPPSARQFEAMLERVFAGTTTSALQNAMARACKAAAIPQFSPHDLRHRRLTRWHDDRVPARVAAERAGHSRPSTTLYVYSHVLDPGEVPASRLAELLDRD